MRGDPARQLLALCGFDEGVTARTQNGDKKRGLECHLAGLGVVDGDVVACVVDEHLFAGPVLVPQNHVQVPLPVAVQLTEAAVMCCNT